jgi:putative ABC transport system substrate-binding protein
MRLCLRRREFIAGLGGAAAWPLAAARAQQRPAVPVIALLQVGAPSSWDFTGFRQGLKDAGYIEGQNVAVSMNSTA